VADNKPSLLRVLYLGEDIAFMNNLQKRFKSDYPGFKWDFKQIINLSDINAYGTLIELLKLTPSIIYVDLSSHWEPMSALGKMVNRIVKFKHVPIVGLLDDITQVEIARASSFELIYVKTPEIHDLIYHPMHFITPEKLNKYEFAEGKCNNPTLILEEVHIGYFTPEKVHFELNQVLPEGLDFHLNCSVLNKHSPSNLIKVNRSGNSDIYYDHTYNADAEMQFVEEPDYEEYEQERNEFIEKVRKKNKGVSEDIVESEIKMATAGYPDAKTLKATKEAEREESKQRFKEWVEEFKSPPNVKTIKICVVDRDLLFLKNFNTNLTKLNFNLRFLDSFSDDYGVVDRIRPNLITYTVNDAKGDPSKVEQIFKEELEVLDKLFKKIIAIKKYNPIVILFNSNTLDVEQLKEQTSYHNIITFPGPIDPDNILKMGEIIGIKEKQKARDERIKKIAEAKKAGQKPSSSDEVEDIVYLNKANNSGYIEYKAEIRSISETTLTFATTTELMLGTFKISDPVGVYVRTVPIEGKKYLKDGIYFIYYALIHGWDEDLKKAIRREVDKIYLKEKAEKEAKEKEDFEKKNQEVIESKKAEEAEEDGSSESEES